MSSSKKNFLPPTHPMRVLEMLQSGEIRTLDNVTDLCAEIMNSVVKKEIPANMARELRQWTELMYTCVQTQSGSSDGDTFVTQLIQMNVDDRQKQQQQAVGMVSDAREPEILLKEAEVIEILDIPEEVKASHG
tara:strand:+ start:362 stop:760 length:399 start_codon:yes stop_codon:yes gene_type:complete